MEHSKEIREAFRWANENRFTIGGALYVLRRLVQAHDAEHAGSDGYDANVEVHTNCGNITEYDWTECYRTDVQLPGAGSRFRVFRPISDVEKKEDNRPPEQVVEANSLLESILLAIEWVVTEDGLPDTSPSKDSHHD